MFGLAALVARTWSGDESSVVPLVSRPVPLSASAIESVALGVLLVSVAVMLAS